MVESSVILFDGVCNLCNGAVKFILRRDVHRKFMFAALQSEAGKKLADKHLNCDNPESIILVSRGRFYQKSTATLRIAKGLPFPYPLLYGFIIVPPFIRNALYSYVARNRYKWFGKQDSCMMPSPDIMERFLK